MKRLSGRRVCPNCGAILEQRPDDKPEVIQERLETYQTETAPIIDYFKLNYPDKTHFVSVEKSIPEVLSQVSANLKQAGLNLAA